MVLPCSVMSGRPFVVICDATCWRGIGCIALAPSVPASSRSFYVDVLAVECTTRRVAYALRGSLC